ncbi:hypothetical protein G3I77_14705 [Streptomyces sp. D2-8]|nr:hypothetical protein [Streptomyces sp. D2-8]
MDLADGVRGEWLAEVLLLRLGIGLAVASAFALFLALPETGVEQLQHLGSQLARLEVAERGLEVVADDAPGPLVRRLVELGDTQPPVKQERHGHLRLGLGLGLLVEVEILLRERVTPGVDPDLEAGPVGADAAADVACSWWWPWFWNLFMVNAMATTNSAPTPER